MTTKWCPICKDDCKEHDCTFFDADTCLVYALLIDLHNIRFQDLSSLIEKTIQFLDSPA